MMPGWLDIIVVNWNGGQLLRDCINAILRSDYLNYCIHIVDNCSSDGSVEFACQKDDINLIRLPQNVGFGGACNKALQFCKGEYILLLNPDTRIASDTLSRAVAYMQAAGDCTVYGCAQEGDNGSIMRTCGRFPNLVTFSNDVLGLSSLMPNVFKNGFIRIDWDHSESGYVEHVMGSFYLIRRQWVLQNGLFDDRFFVYMEDLDLSRRVLQSGGKIFYDRSNVIYHKGGGVSEQVKGKRLFYSLDAKMKFIQKYFSPVSFWLGAFVLLIPSFAIRLLYALIDRRSSVADVMYGYTQLYRSIFSFSRHNRNMGGMPSGKGRNNLKVVR